MSLAARCRWLPAVATVLSIGAWQALAVAPSAAANASSPGQLIEVVGNTDVADADDSATVRRVVPRSELSKFGEARLSDALQRVPGVQVDLAAARPVVRLRGLGDGYTQILVNGEPTRADFSIDSLPLNSIERIEILPVSTAEMRSAGIAGTLNIVLRAAPRGPRRELKASASSQQGQASGTVHALYGDVAGPWSYALGAELARILGEQPVQYEQTLVAPGEVLVSRRFIDRQALNRTSSVTLTPNLSWRPSEGESVRMDSVLRAQRYDGHATNARTTLIGAPPVLAGDDLAAANESTFASTRLHWTLPRTDGSKLETRLSASRLRRDADSTLLGFDPQGGRVLLRRVTSLAVDDSLLTSSTWRAPFASGHALSTGGELEFTRRSESRIQRETTDGDPPPVDLDEAYDARIRRLAVFAQDEWDLESGASVYLGLRWETLGTRTTSGTPVSIGTDAGVWSPVAQLRWPLQSSKSVLRIALSRSFKAPTTIELIPRRWVVPDNTPTTPDFQGNPMLRPELAWGLDLGYEHTLAAGNSVAVTAYLKRIKDVILRDVSQVGGTWVQQPENRGAAQVQGLEFEAKLNFAKLLPDGPSLDLTINATRAWSRVDALQGPDNRLDRQKPYSGSIGIDHRPAGGTLAWGGSLGLVGDAWSRSSAALSDYAPSERRADLYLRWKSGPAMQWRVAMARRTKKGDAETVYADPQGEYRQIAREPGTTTFRVSLEVVR